MSRECDVSLRVCFSLFNCLVCVSREEGVVSGFSFLSMSGGFTSRLDRVLSCGGGLLAGEVDGRFVSDNNGDSQ